MAKRSKKQKQKQEITSTHDLPGGFWRQILALVMIFTAIILVVGWFGKGGVVINFVHQALLVLFGYACYAFPLVLTYLAVKIFRAPGNRPDTSVFLASFLLLCWLAGIFDVPSYGAEKSNGGILGAGLNKLVVGMTSPAIALGVYTVLILITTLFMYAATPADLFRSLKNLFRGSKNSEDAENARVMRRSQADKESLISAGDALKDFKVNSNVDIVDHSAKALLAKSGEEKSKKNEDKKTALTVVSDPNWQMPPLALLNKERSPADPGNTKKNALIIKDTLSQFGIDVEVEDANVGPRITQYTMRPPAGVKVSKIAQLDRDLSLSLAKDKIRIEAPIPGTRSVGIEIPNQKAASVGLHELLSSAAWQQYSHALPLAFALGKDIAGQPIFGNLAKMPHLLIAGTTGSGKSVMTNTLITSLLFHNAPSDLKLIIVDPKQVEMAAYEDIPQLLAPIITRVSEALSAMKWSVNEMERRYSLMREARVKNIVDYNRKMARSAKEFTGATSTEDTSEEPQNNGKMPYIVVIVDEMSDLMMMAGKELEMLVVRIAQKGRAAGIHLVLATQRPEVKVVTGLIKANIPGRIAFAVNNGIDSRVMLDMTGAEKLLGSGDMLYLTTEMMGKPVRVQGAYVSDGEIAKVADFLRAEAPANYNDDVLSQQVEIGKGGNVVMEDQFSTGGSIERQAAEIGLRAGKISTSLLQRRMRIGYGRAAAIIDHLEEMGVVGAPAGSNKGREMLISSIEEFPE